MAKKEENKTILEERPNGKLTEEEKDKLKKEAEEEDEVIIRKAYRILLRALSGKMKGDDQDNIRKAYELAVDAHRVQRRKTGEPYILHPIEVARICVEEMGLGPTAVISALLHDVVEDTDVELDQIREEFGPRVSLMVDGLTKIDNLDAESPQAETLKKIITAMTQDVRTVLIKIADRLHNMKTIKGASEKSRLKVASETSHIYVPLAHRLGLYEIKTQLEDLCMKVLDKDNYKWVADKLQETRRDRNSYIQEFIRPLEEKLVKIGYPYVIYGRAKSISSIWNKVQNKNTPFEDIYDLFAIRIIIDTPSNDLEQEKAACWHAYTIVTNAHKPIPERIKDWVSMPKPNGYQSLHTTVIGPKGRRVEVQIRTKRMHDIAERGFAAHWKYKGVGNDGGNDDIFSKWLDSLRERLENQGNAMEFLSDFKADFLTEEIYVYTPNGDAKMLPIGATALDFAFHIHTDVGYHCQGVKVNGELVPLGHVLKNGDQVHVIKSKAQKPKRSWLEHVTTNRAKSKIRHALREEHRKHSNMGKEILQRKLRAIKVDFENNADILVKHFGYENRPELYYAIYSEALNIQQELKQFDIENGKLTPRETEERQEPQKSPQKGNAVKRKSEPKLMIGDRPAEEYKYTLASCCNPVQGDPVIAYNSVHNGFTIHRNTCPNARHLLTSYAYRIMKASWVDSNNTEFATQLFISGMDGRGMAQKISGFITNELGLDLRSINLDGNEGFFKGEVTIVVKNANQLSHAIKQLKEMEEVYSVLRKDSLE